jgi:CheY-like chemotaxis protein
MKTVLVVDDDRLAKGALQRALEAEGYGTVGVESAKEALEYIKDTQPDVIVTDRQMPEMDGQQLIDQIRELEWGKKVPIIMLTGNEDTEAVNQALESGVVYFSKNTVSLDEVVTAVKQFGL